MPNMQALYKVKKVKKALAKQPTSDQGFDSIIKKAKSTISPKQINARAFLNGYFPEETDVKYFDQLERIQKLMIIDTNPEVL